ncbi:MAG: peptidylprolyl isomerase [Actinobacteria bacterium]|nr:peptidylprolyl isomerase [Actinomycetota bacterium]
MTDRRQRQKEQRAAKREAERKRGHRRELGRRIITALVFGLVVIGIVLLVNLAGEEPDRSGSYEVFREQTTACGAEQPPPVTVETFDEPVPQPDLTAASTVTATLATSCGDIVIELALEDSPETVSSFVFLAREGFYDGQVFHRVAAGFVIQAGDPLADGTGGPGYVIADEHPEGDFVYEEGVVAMANRGARTTGSQFFIVVGESGRFLTNAFNVLGRVVDGEEALDRIAEIPTTVSPGTAEESLPLETVYIETVTIEVSDS